MIVRDQLIEIGQFNKSHGINGEISATLDFDIDGMKAFSCLIVQVEGIFVPFFVAGIREKSAQTMLLQIDGISNEQEATLLVNKKIYVLKSEYSAVMPDDDSEIGIELLVGYDVNTGDNLLGKIVDIEDSTANVLFVVQGNDGNEVLIPVVDDFIEGIDTDEQVIHMNLPEELITIQQ